MSQATIRVYGSLVDFLPAARREPPLTQAFDGSPSVKDVIERLGIPHPEIDLVLVNGESVAYERAVADRDRIAVFPRFRQLDIDAITRVRPARLATPRFVLDGHLGKLARHLRLLGLDTAYRPHAGDDELAASAAEGRILLTRDVGLLKRRAVTHGRFIRHTDARAQLTEVLDRFGPLSLAPLTRCLRCNGPLQPVAKASIEAELQPRTRASYDEFLACADCSRKYWKGSHWPRLRQIVEAAVSA